MIASLPRALGSALRALASATLALAMTGCANFGAPTPAPQALARSSSRIVKPASGSGLVFYTVDYPDEQPNRITGIANNQEIVGVYGNGLNQNQYHSYTSTYSTEEPYTQLQNADYPNAQSTYLTSITSLPYPAGTVEAGYVITPDDLQGTWGVIDNNGIWTLLTHPHEGKCRMTELLGINANLDAVGFYWYDDSAPSGNHCSRYTQYATRVVPGERFGDYHRLEGTYPSADGINNSGWVVGSTNTSGSGASRGWTTAKDLSYKYWNYNNDSKRSTQMWGLNDSGVVVGTYKDVSGNWHGFIASNLFSNPNDPVWQSIDEPDGNGTNTVVSGIDSSGDICGWYTGTDGVVHGFVAIYS